MCQVNSEVFKIYIPLTTGRNAKARGWTNNEGDWKNDQVQKAVNVSLKTQQLKSNGKKCTSEKGKQTPRKLQGQGKQLKTARPKDWLSRAGTKKRSWWHRM